MLSVDQITWNQIAHEQTLYSGWAQKMFNLPRAEATAEQRKTLKSLKTQGYSDLTALAYLTALPLLLENQAISRFIVETDNLELRNQLPEVTDVQEALWLLSQDYPLDPKEMRDVEKLLNQALKKELPKSEKSS